MTSVEKCIAAVGAIGLSAFLIWKGETAPAIAIAGSLVGFFVGDSNGFKNGVQSTQAVNER